MESILDDRELVGERSENFIPSEGKTFDHGEESDVFEFDDDGESEKGKSTLLINDHISYTSEALAYRYCGYSMLRNFCQPCFPTRISDFLIFSD